MRPLLLTLQAFESYLQKAVVDFRPLGSQGLFLIDGPTGAGKTTIFQAMLFAFYGCTTDPDNVKPEDLRTIGAPLDVATFVELSFVHLGRTYKIYREPKQLLRKERGEGEGWRKANAFLWEEKDDGKEEMLAKGIDQVNQAVMDLLRLNADQFQKVVLIPQGEFRKVIVDKTVNRQEIFRKIFHTEIYDEFAQSLNDLAIQAKTALSQSLAAQDAAFAQAKVKDDDGGLLERKQDLVRQSTYEEKETFLNDLVLRYKGLSQENQILAAKWQKELSSLASEKKDCLTYQEAVDEKTRMRLDLDRVEKGLRENEAKLAEFETLKPQIDAWNGKIGAIEARLPDYGRLESLQVALAQARQSAADSSRGLSSNRDRLSYLQNRLAHDRKALMAITEDPFGELKELGAKELALQKKEDGLQALKLNKANIDDLGEEVEKAEGEVLKATESSQRADEEYGKAKANYYRNLAGQVAHDYLIDGKPCPVCGSLDHPLPAKLVSGAMTKAGLEEKADEVIALSRDLAAAGKALENARREKAEAVKLVVEGLADYGCKGYDDIPSCLTAMAKDVGTAKFKLDSEKERLTKLRDEKERLSESVQEENEAIAKLTKETEEMNTLLTKYSTEASQFDQSATDLANSLPYPTRDQANDVLDDLRGKVKDNQRVLGNLQAKEADLKLAQGQKQAGFNKAQETIAKFEDQGIRPLKTVEEDLRKAQAEFDHCSDLGRKSYSLWEADDSALKELRKIHGEIAEKQVEADRIDGLSQAFSGRVNGQARTSVEAFVQSRYLDLVLAKANARFRPMTGGRFYLVRSQVAYDNVSKSGLDINVFDTYQGAERKAATLSGGETFLAALALALGLADEVTQRFGGIRLDCMFIDEGFGTLDQSRLDGLLDILVQQTVGEGKVLVGLISHVEELNRLIPNRIEVRKDAYGHSFAKVVGNGI